MVDMVDVIWWTRYIVSLRGYSTFVIRHSLFDIRYSTFVIRNMPTYPLLQIDAFTDRPLGGNPCAVVFDSDDLPVDTMQAIAREMNLSETAFVMQSEIADFKVRYFTPAEEIPLAGHPTIATTFALVESGRLNLDAELTTISLELQVGPIRVDIQSSAGNIGQIIMTQKKPVFLQTYSAERILSLFSLSPEDLLQGARIQTVSTGTPQLMVPIKNHESLKRISVNMSEYAAFREEEDFFSAHLFCISGISEDAQTFARHFGTPPDIFEDPFTGSATGGMSAYVWKYGLVEEPTFIAEQGHWMGRPGKAHVEVVGPRDDIETVRVGGQAALVMRGELIL